MIHSLLLLATLLAAQRFAHARRRRRCHRQKWTSRGQRTAQRIQTTIRCFVRNGQGKKSCPLRTHGSGSDRWISETPRTSSSGRWTATPTLSLVRDWLASDGATLIDQISLIRRRCPRCPGRPPNCVMLSSTAVTRIVAEAEEIRAGTTSLIVRFEPGEDSGQEARCRGWSKNCSKTTGQPSRCFVRTKLFAGKRSRPLESRGRRRGVGGGPRCNGRGLEEDPENVEQRTLDGDAFDARVHAVAARHGLATYALVQQLLPGVEQDPTNDWRWAGAT